MGCGRKQIRNPKQNPRLQIQMTETGRIGGLHVVAPGFHAGRVSKPKTPGVEAGRYNVLAASLHVSVIRACFEFRASDFEFLLPRIALRFTAKLLIALFGLQFLRHEGPHEKPEPVHARQYDSSSRDG
jgi:hypothetical protein